MGSFSPALVPHSRIIDAWGSPKHYIREVSILDVPSPVINSLRSIELHMLYTESSEYLYWAFALIARRTGHGRKLTLLTLLVAPSWCQVFESFEELSPIVSSEQFPVMRIDLRCIYYLPLASLLQFAGPPCTWLHLPAMLEVVLHISPRVLAVFATNVCIFTF